MLKLAVILVCLSVAFGVGYSTSTVAPSKAGVSTTPSCSPSTNSSNCEPIQTTAPPTTTLKPTTSPTQRPNGTTTPRAPNVTTTATPTNGSTTPKPTNGSTTLKPTNGTTTLKPTNGTTTPKPTNVTTTPKTTPTTKPPTYGDFSLSYRTDNKTKYCLLAQFAATFTIHYMKFLNKTTKATEKAIIYLNRTNNDDVNITGDCGINKTVAMLTLSWPKNESYYTLKMEFSKVAKTLEAKNNTSTKWKVNMISLKIILQGNKKFMNPTEPSITSHSKSGLPSGNLGGYYLCEAKTDLKLNTSVSSYSVDADFQDLKVEPFVAKNTSDEFGKKTKQCYQDNPTGKPTTEAPNNDIVPIAVGCALAGLVLIVLIAYIIGRRKSHRGYEKV